LDGLRGIAAFGIMFYHLWFNSRWFLGTNTFVDFFFVLSGFVLAPSLAKENGFSARKFITKRLMRLYPILVPVFITLIASEKIPLLSRKLHSNPHPFVNYLGAFLLLQIFWGSLLHINIALWSLSAEWFVNIISAIFSRRGRNFYLIMSFGVFAETLGLTLNHKYHLGWGVIQYLIAAGRALVGFYLGLFLRHRLEVTNKVSGPSYKICALLFIVVLNFFLFAVSDYFVILAAPIFYFVILHLAKYEENKFPSSFLKGCSYLGKISYGVYVWHLVIGGIHIPILFIDFMGWHLTGIWLRFFTMTITVSLTILATEMSIKFFEIPIRKIAGRLFD